MKAEALSGELIDLRQARIDRLKRQSVASIVKTRSGREDQIIGGLRVGITSLDAASIPSDLETELSRIRRRLHKISDRIEWLGTSPGYRDDRGDPSQAPRDIASLENIIAQLAKKIDSSLACEAASSETTDLSGKLETLEARQYEPAMTARIGQFEGALDYSSRQVNFSQWTWQVTLIQRTFVQRLEQADPARDCADLPCVEQLPQELNDNTTARIAADQRREEIGMRIEVMHSVAAEEEKLALRVMHNFSRATIGVEFGSGDALVKRELWDKHELGAVQRCRFTFVEAARRTMQRGIAEIKSGQKRKLAGDGLWIGAAAKAPLYDRIYAYDKVCSFAHLKRAVACWLFGTILAFGGYFAGHTSIVGSTVSSPNVLEQGGRSVSLHGGAKPNAESGTAPRRNIALIHARPPESIVPSLIRASYMARSSIGGSGVSTSSERGEPKKSTNLDSLAEATTENLGAPSAYDIATRPPVPNQAAEAAASTSVIAKPQSSPNDEPNISGGAVQERAMQGDAAAQYELGIRLLKGRDLRQDLKAAASWLEKAANQGFAPAQLRLGIIYGNGMGVNRDSALARKWFQAAAENGNAPAMHNLAVLLAEDQHRKPEYKLAIVWLRRAAELGVLDSQYNLGVYYQRGIGVEKNLVQSYAWFATAAARGDVKASQKRKEVVALLDPEELVSAKALADRIKRRQTQMATRE